MKRIALFILGIATVIGLSSCTGLNQGSFNFSLNSESEILAFQALSSVNMIDAQNEQTLSSSRISKMSDEEETSIDQIKPYLELFEQLLTQSNGLSVTTEASDLVEYETKQVFTVTDLLGEQVTYTMYYSEVALTDDEDDEADETDDMDEVDEIEDEDDEEDENEDDEQDEDDVE